MEILSQNLKLLRESRNYSQSAVAGIIFVTPAAYCHYEKGRHEPSLDALKRLSRLYNVTLDSLVNEPMQKS